MLKKIALFTGWLIILSFSLLFCFTLGLWQVWSTPVILLIWIVIILLSILSLGVSQYILSIIKGKKRNRYLDKYRLSSRDYLLWNRWKQGAIAIKNIGKRRSKMPWYILVGERCGKSTLLDNSDLPRFFYGNEDNATKPTRMLNWWFFSNLAVLDISSNFLSEKKNFRQAWIKLVQWCLRLPAPAGVVIALSMSELISGDFTLLRTTARRQRIMLEPLLRHFGENLPLYVMITKCDCFPGFSLWQQQLSPKQCEQMLGYIWDIPPCIDCQDEYILQPLFNKLHSGLSQARLSMAKPIHLNENDYIKLIDFPEKFILLETPLRYIIATLCAPNIWFSHAKFGGIWFSSVALKTKDRGKKMSFFANDLLKKNLVSLSKKHKRIYWYHKKHNKIIFSFIFFLWLLISSIHSFERLQPDILKLSQNELAIYILRDEVHSVKELRYLPFLPLFRKKLQLANLQLSKVPSYPRGGQLNEYLNKALSASPQQQRKYILQLSDALLIWKKMGDGATLDELAHFSSIPDSLQQRSYPDNLLTLTKLALERYYIQQPNGEVWQKEARQVLAKLVNNDASLNWLIAPDTELPSLHASEFWPSLSDSVEISGAWTHDGEIQINKWIYIIEGAIGKNQPLFHLFRERWPLMRQNAWGDYISEVTVSISDLSYSNTSKNLLFSIIQNRSPSMLFLSQINKELENIPKEQTQPWLSMLRLTQGIIFPDATSTIFTHAVEENKHVRQSLTKWLKQSQTSPILNGFQPSDHVWRKWQDVRNKVVDEAITYDRSYTLLTRGLFNNFREENINTPIKSLLPVFTEFRIQVSPENHDSGIMNIWRLYQDDAWLLLGNAMAQSACWLDAKWKSIVIWPLEKNTEQRNYEEQQELKKEVISTFIQGPGRELLSHDSQGINVANYAGLAVPLNNDFLRLVKELPVEILHDLPSRPSIREKDQLTMLQEHIALLDKKQATIENNIQRINVTSLPATVPEGANVLPTGTQLSLYCKDGEQKLINMNFTEKAEFVWFPGQCKNVSLIVNFPDFKVHYELNGDKAWPEFINLFTSGDHLLKNSDFGDDGDLLNNLGIKNILVRFTISDPQYLESVWQDWRQNVEQIDHINAQINNIYEHIEQRKPAILLTHPLSKLPVNIAQCKYTIQGAL